MLALFTTPWLYFVANLSVFKDDLQGMKLRRHCDGNIDNFRRRSLVRLSAKSGKLSR